MASNAQNLVLVKPRAKTFYERWLDKEAIPVVEGFGVADVKRLALGPWKRLGCEGAYLQLRGLDGITGVYIGKLAPGAMTHPERHLYEKILYILQGEGVAEVQQRDRVPQAFTWRAGSLFSVPLNAMHRLANHGSEPAFFVAVTTAPMVLDHFHNERFVFESDFTFADRYDGEPDYFRAGEEGYLGASRRQWICETNFIPDTCGAAPEAQEPKGGGAQVTQFEMACNTLIGRLTEWPVGRYRKAHDQGSGAVLVVLRSEGYSLMWPRQWGPRPYESGYCDRIVRVNWMPGSVFALPIDWYHQHFNTGAERALHLGLGCESHKFPMGVKVGVVRGGIPASIDAGKSAIEYGDEDPEIRRRYEAELKRNGVAPEMDLECAANDRSRVSNLA